MDDVVDLVEDGKDLEEEEEEDDLEEEEEDVDDVGAALDGEEVVEVALADAAEELPGAEVEVALLVEDDVFLVEVDLLDEQLPNSAWHPVPQ